MAIETTTTTINGAAYSCTTFAAMTGVRLQSRLVKLFGPALATAAGGLRDGQGLADLDMVVMGRAVQQLMDTLDEETAIALIQLLVSQTKRNNKELTEGEFNLAYAGNYAELYQALWWVIQVNNFFPLDRIGSLMASGLQPPAPPSPAPSTLHS